MEKSGGRHYRYEPYHQQKNNGKTASLKRNTTASAQAQMVDSDVQTRCFCFSWKNSANYGLVQGLFSNLGICALLIGYTLLGSFVFLAIEGGGNNNSLHYQRSYSSSATTSVAGDTANHRRVTGQNGSSSTWFKRVSDESRAKTVENIWDITVSLNILYRDNWTRLAAQEISRFQEQLVQRLSEEMAQQSSQGGSSRDRQLRERRTGPSYEWNFARAFLYSLTVLTTIGYGNIAPRTSLGKAVTMGYAVLGIPLMLVYLSSVGSLLSRCVRGAFSKTLCCCLCSNCGYCCYDEKRMQEKERRMKKKRQQMEMQQQQVQEPFYVRSSSSVTAFTTSASSTHNNLHSPARDGDLLKQTSVMGEPDYVVDSAETKKQRYHSGSLLTPVALCLCVMVLYICGGALVLVKLESWSFLDGAYFCFMSLSTIGFGDLLPGGGSGTVWFCSVYILTGMALTAMCFNILHDEIVHRLKHQGSQLSHEKDSSCSSNFLEDTNGADPYSTSS